MENQIKQKLDEVLSLNWEKCDRDILESALKNILSFRRFIPNSLLEQIIKCVDICIREKKELDELRTRQV